jgi:hypothetical protein
MIYPSPNISKRDWAMQKEKKEKDMLKKHDKKRKEEKNGEDSPCLKYFKKRRVE